MTASASRARREVIEAVVSMMSERPTSGETMPPKRNPVAPNMADAAPTAMRPSSIARVVVDVKMRPRERRVRNVSDS